MVRRELSMPAVTHGYWGLKSISLCCSSSVVGCHRVGELCLSPAGLGLQDSRFAQGGLISPRLSMNVQAVKLLICLVLQATLGACQASNMPTIDAVLRGCRWTGALTGVVMEWM